MDEPLQQKIFERFSDYFENRKLEYSCLCFGIECGNGWYDIIYHLCAEIQNHEENIAQRKRHNPEYQSQYTKVIFDQIKEKFGGLRIYFNGGDDYVRGLVTMAESLSYCVCEICGNKGFPNKNGWISTLCEAHRNS